MLGSRRGVGLFEPGFQFLSALGIRAQLLLRLAREQLVVKNQVDQLLASSLDTRELTLGGVDAGAALHPKAAHLLGELAAELLEEVLAHQFVLERPQYSRLDFLTRDRQLVGARAAVPSAEASEVSRGTRPEARGCVATTSRRWTACIRKDGSGFSHDVAWARGGNCGQ
jgi:hypothetical protein